MRIKNSLIMLLNIFFCSFFFFFQAEDGIRDTSVTGVQTCALPIFIEKLLNWIFGKRYWVSGGYGSNHSRISFRSCRRRLMKWTGGAEIPWFAGCAKIGRASCRERV